jgi:nicotinamide-nucleotide amidase
MKTNPPRRFAVLSIGDELLFGQSVDTNSAWIAERLEERGALPTRREMVGDDRAEIASALLRLAGDADLVVATGGLGPTPDDLTREGLADALGDEIVEDPDLLEQLRARFRSVGRDMPESNRSQATRPASAEGIENRNGTAPALLARLGEGASATIVACLPGPPAEMRPLLDEMIGRWFADAPKAGVRTKLLHVFGLGESAVAERLGELLLRERRPVVGTTARDGVVTIRIRGDAASMADAVDETAAEARRRVGAFVFGEDDETLASCVVDLLRTRGETLVVAESCTGGMLGEIVTSVAGSSDVFHGGWTTYTNAMKESALGVAGETIERHGAVSAEVVREMAEGALRSAPGGGAAHALSISGVAGPGGGSDAKPVGTVWIGRASRDLETGGLDIETRRFRFPGDRRSVRMRSSLAALAMLRLHATGAPAERMLWETGGGDAA